MYFYSQWRNYHILLVIRQKGESQHFLPPDTHTCYLRLVSLDFLNASQWLILYDFRLRKYFTMSVKGIVKIKKSQNLHFPINLNCMIFKTVMCLLMIFLLDKIIPYFRVCLAINTTNIFVNFNPLSTNITTADELFECVWPFVGVGD